MIRTFCAIQICLTMALAQGCMADLPYRDRDGVWVGGDTKIRRLIEAAQEQTRDCIKEADATAMPATTVIASDGDDAQIIRDDLGGTHDGKLTLIISPSTIGGTRYAIVVTSVVENDRHRILNCTKRYEWEAETSKWVHSPLKGGIHLVVPVTNGK